MACSVDGNADMYGLGIRLGFYLNWFAGILASLIAVQEIETIRYALTCFIGATFIAVVVQTGQGADFTTLDTYIVLLLCFGFYCSMIPTFIWRLATCFNPRLDPTRWPRIKPSATFAYVHVLLVAAVAGFQLWFWVSEVPKFSSCGYQGFLFARFRLADIAFKYVNIACQAIILGICLVSIGAQVVENSRTASRPLHISETRKSVLRLINAVVGFIVAAIIVVATELTIIWNGVGNVYVIDSAGQLIPFIVGVGVIGRVLYLGIRGGFQAKTMHSSSHGHAGYNDQDHMGTMYVPMPFAKPPDADYTSWHAVPELGARPSSPDTTWDHAYHHGGHEVGRAASSTTPTGGFSVMIPTAGNPDAR